MCIHRESYTGLLVRISALTGHTARMYIIYICAYRVPVCICILGMYCFNSLTLIFLFFFLLAGLSAFGEGASKLDLIFNQPCRLLFNISYYVLIPLIYII